MKILISADIEGVNGVVHPDQIYPDGKFYNETLVKWTKELNTIITALNESGINSENIIINDSHNHMRNLNSSSLPNACVLSGWQKPFSMVSQADKVDACFFTGYHAKATASAVLSHTYRPRIIKNVNLNGVSVGETGLNAALAGFYNIPVLLVNGDEQTCSEAKEILDKNLITVPSKNSLSRYSAISYPFEKYLENLRTGAMTAVKSFEKIKPYKVSSPYTIQITFAEPNHADAACLIPDTKRINDVTVELSNKDYSILFKAFLGMGALAASRDDVLT